MAAQFNGKIELDIRDSEPDWGAFLDQTAPKDAPNVLVILYDDTGCAAWSTYGGRINMPTLDRLASGDSPTPNGTRPRSARRPAPRC